MELGRDRVLRDVLVMRRQRVSRKAEGADPKAGAYVDRACEG